MPRAHRAAPAQSQGIRERRPRSARLEIDAAALLPQDEQREGFDNIAAALQVSPSFIEQYLIAARTVAVQAVGRPMRARAARPTARRRARSTRTFTGLPLGTRGGILAEHYFPSDGEYEINIADMAGHIWGNDMEFENTVLVTLDSKEIYRTVIGGDEHMKRYDQEPAGAFDCINATLKNIRFAATAGPHKLGVTFLRRTFAESDDRIEMFVPGGGQDRVYRVSSFQVERPVQSVRLERDAEPRADLQLPSRPRRGRRSCAPKRSSRRSAARAFRRPLAETDLARLHAVLPRRRSAGGFEEGIRSAVTGILASPNFLYRGERVPHDLAAGTQYRIDDLELASKLSFFLWNTIPDDELRDLASRGELSDADGAPAAGRPDARGPALPTRSPATSSTSGSTWLGLDEVEPDRAVFPYASGSGDPRSDYMTELTLFAKSIFDEDRSVVGFMTAKHTYVNERVALLYGIERRQGRAVPARGARRLRRVGACSAKARS